MRTGIHARRRRETHGFSRTDLVVLLVILAIIAALSIAAIFWAKARARQALCQSNLKQLGSAALVCMNESANAVPRNVPAYPQGDWMGSLRNYYKLDQLRVCPVAPVRLPNPPPGAINGQGTADKAWVRWTSDGGTMFYGSYAFNSWFHDVKGRKGTQFYEDQVINLQTPSQTPLFVDANWVNVSPKETDAPCNNLYIGRPLQHGGIGRCTISRHGGIDPAKAPRTVAPGQALPGAINLGMYDGHVELAPLEKLWTFSWHRDWKTPAFRPDVKP